MIILVLCSYLISSSWVYFVVFGDFAYGVHHKVYVGLDISWFIVSSSLKSALFVVKERPHVRYIVIFLHIISEVPKRKVFDSFTRDRVHLAFVCHLNLLSLGMDDFKT